MPSSRYSTITNERNLKMRIPRPVEGLSRIYGYHGSLNEGRLGSQMGGFKPNNL